MDSSVSQPSQWKSGISMLPLSRFRKQNGISDSDYTPFYKFIKDNPQKYGYDENSDIYKYIVNTGEFLVLHDAYENRYKGFVKVGNKVTFAISKSLNEKVT